SGAPICGELQKLSALRTFCWASAVPILPGEAPITADGLRVNEFVPYGRLAQSIAFFRLPGMPRVVLGGDEQHRVHRGDGVLEGATGRRVIGVEVPVVHGKVPDRDLRQRQILWS